MGNQADDLDRQVLDSTGAPCSVASLRERISEVEPGVFVMRELNSGSPETLPVMTQEIERLAAGHDVFGIAIDLSEAEGSTTSEYRKFIPKHFAEIFARAGGRLKIVSVAFTGSPVARVASQFLIGRMTHVPFKLEKNAEDAIAAVRNAIQR